MKKHLRKKNILFFPNGENRYISVEIKCKSPQKHHYHILRFYKGVTNTLVAEAIFNFDKSNYNSLNNVSNGVFVDGTGTVPMNFNQKTTVTIPDFSDYSVKFWNFYQFPIGTYNVMSYGVLDEDLSNSSELKTEYCLAGIMKVIGNDSSSEADSGDSTKTSE